MSGIDGKGDDLSTPDDGFGLAAQGTDAVLLGHHGVILCGGEFVIPPEVAGPPDADHAFPAVEVSVIEVSPILAEFNEGFLDVALGTAFQSVFGKDGLG